ncbi:MAG: helicase-associated domain-containing protein [Candidatus Hydrogenedentes bacterium]|nr:helicase-associated domain-containing protein [Candidatus Hydrogenedentota bacterium]
MRHRASLLASMEGISRATFLIARDLSQNSRSGLTPRFLAKKLEITREEVEYLVDINPKLLYTDLTKIRLAPEGFHAVKRILEGLESHGDIAALLQRIRNLHDQDLQRIEERLGLEEGLSKKDMFEQARVRIYKHPDSVLNYVASRDFSECARNVFDILWQSKDGILTISQLYTAHGGTEYDIEQALGELFRGCACFELFRFDAEDRLMRVAALLKEARDYKQATQPSKNKRTDKIKPVQGVVEDIRSEALAFSEVICRITASIAARPVRLRNDGELFLADKRRLDSICGEDIESLRTTCLWVAEGLGWIARVDNTLCAGMLDEISGLSRLERHRLVCTWLTTQDETAKSRILLEDVMEEIKPCVWYPVMDFLGYARSLIDQSAAPELRPVGAHSEYISPSVSTNIETRMARSLEGTLFWLGMVDRGYVEGDPCFRISPIGSAILSDTIPAALEEQYPERRGAFVVQPNYEIVAAIEDMEPLLTVPLETFAERVSTSRVMVYRLTRDSFVRAMQEGRNPDVFIEFLLNNSRDPLPENVLITLKDWRGGAKQVRIRTWHVIEADDPLVITELAHHQHWKKQLDSIDPHKTLRYHDLSRAELKRTLEKDGYIVK